MSDTTDGFRIVVQRGIEGGFAPPVPSARYTLVRAPGGPALTITLERRAHGTPVLGAPTTRVISLGAPDASNTNANGTDSDGTDANTSGTDAASLARLLAILGEIPTQYPGARDLYGRNVSIVYVPELGGGGQGEGLQQGQGQAWFRTGSAAGAGIEPPTEAQRALFDEALAIVEAWAAAG